MFVQGGGTKKKFLQEGETLFKEGDPGDAAFIVDSGEVAIRKFVEGEEVELACLKSGELFGEMAIIDGSERMAHAVAKEETVVIVIPATALENRLAKTDPFLKALMNILVNNLRLAHNAYMRRARSVNDYLNAVDYHTKGFRLYLARQQETSQVKEGIDKLDQIDRLVDELRTSFKDFPDPRSSALTDIDVSRRKPDGK